MRRVALALAATVVGLIVLLSYKSSAGGSTRAVALAPGPAGLGSAGTSASGTASGNTSSNGDTSRSASGATSAPRATTASSTRTISGSAVPYDYGTLQVEITVSGGKLTAVTPTQQPSDGHSMRINTYALPILEQEAVSAQSAQIDTVSGATLTSDAFARSLQSALQQA